MSVLSRRRGCPALFLSLFLLLAAYPKKAAAQTGVETKEGVSYSFTQRKWRELKGLLKEALAPRYRVRQNFFGVHYKNFILGDTLRFTDEDHRVRVSAINDNFNAWGFFYVNLHDFLRTRFAANFYEYVRLNYAYNPEEGSSNTIDQIKLNEGDFSVAYSVYLERRFPLYAGLGLTAGHMKIQSGSRARQKVYGYVGPKLIFGGSYIFDETLYLDACFHSIPFGLNQGYATTISTGIAF